MNISAAFQVALLIGRGPSTPGWVSRVIMGAIGVIVALVAIAPGTRGGGLFSYWKGPSGTIDAAGRVILALVALTMLALALAIIR